MKWCVATNYNGNTDVMPKAKAKFLKFTILAEGTREECENYLLSMLK